MTKMNLSKMALEKNAHFITDLVYMESFCSRMSAAQGFYVEYFCAAAILGAKTDHVCMVVSLQIFIFDFE